MARMKNSELAEYIHEALLDYDKRSIPILSAGDIVRLLKEKYGIDYNNSQYIHSKIHSVAKESDKIDYTYIGNSRGYYPRELFDAYFNRR